MQYYIFLYYKNEFQVQMLLRRRILLGGNGIGSHKLTFYVAIHPIVALSGKVLKSRIQHQL
ncbi:hypothetical protein T07_4693 [Trichinella nelsoni]|uniref:Uncharacterized protein n=1 Tax=Trichinella nelsoni TaxID=6336 RepID=A0A0V0S4M3_9BILA|nr:hypothetical protein T07_4693 [Trichinella nelsoni]